MLESQIEPGTPSTPDEILELEQCLGRAIPDAYRVFIRKYGGAFVGGMIDGRDDLPILAFFDANAARSALLSHLDLKKIGVLPIGDCELGNLYVIDREEEVHYINFYGGNISSDKVSTSFKDLLSRIEIIDS